MWGLCQFLPQQCDEDGRTREKNYPAQDLQGVNGPPDERKRKDVKSGEKVKDEVKVKKKFILNLSLAVNL